MFFMCVLFVCSSCVCSTRVFYLRILPVSSTCVFYLFVLPVCSTCMFYLCVLHVCSTCMFYLCVSPVYFTCMVYLVFYLCFTCLFYLFVLPMCSACVLHVCSTYVFYQCRPYVCSTHVLQLAGRCVYVSVCSYSTYRPSSFWGHWARGRHMSSYSAGCCYRSEGRWNIYRARSAWYTSCVDENEQSRAHMIDSCVILNTQTHVRATFYSYTQIHVSHLPLLPDRIQHYTFSPPPTTLKT